MKKTYTKKQIQEAIKYWKKQLRKMNESADNEIRIPDLSNNDDKAIRNFEDTIDRIFGGSAYQDCIPDKYEDIDGEQCDLDDFDVHRVYFQEALPEEDFWEKILDELADCYEPGEIVTAGELEKTVRNVAKHILDDAIEDGLTDDNCIHHGQYKSEAYWRS